MREYIYNIISISKKGSRKSAIYDAFIIVVSLLSIAPMMFDHPEGTLKVVLGRLETITVYLLFLDYILCWMTQDFRVDKHSPWAFILYPVTPMALFNLLALLPSLGLLPAQFAILRLFRLVKILQYSKSCRHIVRVFQKERRTLFSILLIALFYIFVSALIMFVVEPEETFNDFFHALYWATTALTTVGYGDVYPITDLGRLISMVSSLFGIAVIALPAGIVTAGFVDAISEEVNEKEAAAAEEAALLQPDEPAAEESYDMQRLEQLLEHQQTTITQLQTQLTSLQEHLMEQKPNDHEGGVPS